MGLFLWVLWLFCNVQVRTLPSVFTENLSTARVAQWKSTSPRTRRLQVRSLPRVLFSVSADVPKRLRGSPAKRVSSGRAGSNPAVCVYGEFKYFSSQTRTQAHPL